MSFVPSLLYEDVHVACFCVLSPCPCSRLPTPDYGMQPYLGVSPAESVKLYVILSPVGPYYKVRLLLGCR